MAVSARKRKAQINKQFLEKVKKHNEETSVSIDELGDELFNSFVEGAAEEIKKSPHLTSIAEKFSDIVIEFFNGVREGIDSELANIRAVSDAVNLSKAVIESSASGNEELLDALKDIKSELEGTNNELKGFNNTLKEQIKEAKEAARQATGDITSASREYIKPKYGMAGKVGRFAVSMLDGIPGLEKFGLGSKYLEKYDERESWIRNQQKLDPSLSRKELKKNYKVVQQSITELKELENEKEILRRQGYSDEQIEKIGGYESKIQEKLKNIIPFDKRFEKYEKALRTATIGSDLTTSEETSLEDLETQKKQLDEQEKQSKLLEEIDKRYEKYEKALRATISEKALRATISEKALRTATIGSDLTTSEETSLEDLETQKKQLDEQEKQSKLLEEIAALLRKPAGADKNNKEQKEGGGLLDNLPGLDIDINGKKSPRRTPRRTPGRILNGVKGLFGTGAGSVFKKGTGSVINAGKGAFSAAARFGARALPFAIPGAIALAGINAVDWAAGKAGVGDVEIDEEQDNINWQKMSGMEKLESGAARFIEKAGNFLGLDNIANQARADRIEKETKYFENKEKEAYQLAREKTETENKEQIIDPSTGNLVNKKEISVSEKVYNNTQKEEITIKEMGKEIGANIKVNVPPVVIPPQQEKVVPTPFSQIMKNNEPSISSYIRSRYAY